MDSNLNIKILEFYKEIEKINNNINNKMFDFITKASELVDLSNDDYQREKTLKLNKISLKGYILDSQCCIQLSNNNIVDYSLEELKEFLKQYEKLNNDDCSKYFLTLSLYEMIEDIENQVDSKIDLELKELSTIIPDINKITSAGKLEYENSYMVFKNQINNYQEKLDEKSYNICLQILNDVFNFYISGYPNIPDEYLSKEIE